MHSVEKSRPVPALFFVDIICQELNSSTPDIRREYKLQFLITLPCFQTQRLPEFLESSRAWYLYVCVDKTRRGKVSVTDGANDDDSESGKTNKQSVAKRASILSNISGASDDNTAGSSHMDLNRINTLRTSVNKHNEVFTKFLLTCKEIAEKRSQIAFRFCKETFLEMATNRAYLLKVRSKVDIIEEVKQTVYEAVDDIKTDIGSNAVNIERVKMDAVGAIVHIHLSLRLVYPRCVYLVVPLLERPLPRVL